MDEPVIACDSCLAAFEQATPDLAALRLYVYALMMGQRECAHDLVSGWRTRQEPSA